MKFTKGMIIGGLISAGIIFMYNEGMMNKNKMIKKGRQFVKKLGVM